MTKTFGANIRCSACDAQPYPDNPATTRETFDLLRIGDDWFCELHRPPKKRVPRAVNVTPRDALHTFEALLKVEEANLSDAIDDDDHVATAALERLQQEVARGLAQLKKAIG